MAGEPVPLGGSAEVVILRTAQEARSNVRRHAAAEPIPIASRPRGTAVLEKCAAFRVDSYPPARVRTLQFRFP